jgi:murein DD-endopeptidase MepM/ murein hydrolase activator NlpD
VLIVTAVTSGMYPGPSAGAADGDRRDAETIAEERLEAARAQAVEVLQQLNAITAEQAAVEAEIAEAERQIPVLRARAVELKELVKQRAVVLYRSGGGVDLNQLVDAGSALELARASHFTNTVGDHDLALATELRDTAAKLAVREAELRTRRAELTELEAKITPLADLLQRRLEAATAAYEKVRAVLAFQRVGGNAALVTTDATRCPVNGFVVFTDDFGVPRPGGEVHEGIDMPALAETPVVAVTAGLMRHDLSPRGGNGAWLVGLDGVGYYYAHFSRYEGGERLVAPGEVIGYVGITGVTTGPHLHFEVHPGGMGAGAIDGFAILLGLCSQEMALPRG